MFAHLAENSTVICSGSAGSFTCTQNKLWQNLSLGRVDSQFILKIASNTTSCCKLKKKNSAGPITTDPPMRILFINENLTQYRKEMMSLDLQKKNDQKITSARYLDGKIFLKTSPSGRPWRMHSKDDIMEL